MHKVRSIQKWFVEIDVEELDWPARNPDFNPIKHLWDELERQLRARPNHPTSVPNLANALMAERKQIPAAMFQHLVESPPEDLDCFNSSGNIICPHFSQCTLCNFRLVIPRVVGSNSSFRTRPASTQEPPSAVFRTKYGSMAGHKDDLNNDTTRQRKHIEVLYNYSLHPPPFSFSSRASDLTPSPVTSSKGVLTAGVGTTAKTSVSERPSVSTGSRGSNSTMEPQSTSSSSEGSDAPTNVVSNTRETSENNTSSITPTSNKAAVTETESSSTMITVNTTSSDSGIQTTPLNNSTAKPSESEFTSSQNRLSFTETPTVPMSTTQTNPEIDSTTALSVVIQGLISTVTSEVTTSTLMTNDESSDEHPSRRVLWLVLGVGGGCMLLLAFLATLAFQCCQSRTKRSWVIPKDTHEVGNGRHANGCHDNPGMESCGLSENGNGMGGEGGDKGERPARDTPDSWVVPLEVMTSMQEAAARLVNDTRF
uniref:uncharacterized protein n=1 Tax=Myxine glutinosa TaxID=7769 RepID=UPI00358E9025